MYNKFYIATMCTVFVMAAVVLTTFPRPAYSEVEKRELTKFPEWSWDRLVDGSFIRMFHHGSATASLTVSSSSLSA